MSMYSESDVPDQSGKTMFVTGANTGIGFEAARVLAQRGARVLLGCRSRSKAQSARERIVEVAPKAEVEIIDLDLNDLASVRSAAKRVTEEERLDVLINNAGIMMPPRQLTADGFESQFGVNHLGHFALTGLLLDMIADREGGRIVSVSSVAHRNGEMHFDDLNAERSYSKIGRYAQSKLANLLFTFELERRLRAGGHRAIALACHPGGAMTELSRYLPRFAEALMAPIGKLVLNTAAEGALPTLRAATDPQAQGGDYYGPQGHFEIAKGAHKVQAKPHAHDRAAMRLLWETSIDLTGVDPGLT